MKVTAFIRKTSAKNTVTDLARVYFRVRESAAWTSRPRAMSINPNHWCWRGKATNHVWLCLGREEERFTGISSKLPT